MFQKWLEKRKLRIEKIQEAKGRFISFLDISKSSGWEIYNKEIEKKIEIIKNKMNNDTTLTGEDLKRLQLALQVWNEVKRIPKSLEENAKKEMK